MLNSNYAKPVKIFALTAALFLTFAMSGCGNQGKNADTGQESPEKPIEIIQKYGNVEVKKKMLETEVYKDKNIKEVHGSERGVMMAKTDYGYEGFLTDVTGGSAAGRVLADYDGKNYKMYASFAGLPELNGQAFYEGWIVREDPFSFVSTGRIKKMGGIYNNLYQSGQDFTNYDLYVLTYEPDDSDPAPGEHILEGRLSKVKKD